MPSIPHITAALLAGGRGERLGGDIPKQFLQLVDRPMFLHSLDMFQACAAISSVVLVVPDPPRPLPQARYPKLIAQVPGGSTRQASVARALAALPKETDLVMVHDAARPLAGPELIDLLIEGLDDEIDGVVPGVPLEDSVKRVGPDRVLQHEVDRTGVWRVQTPQLARRGALEKALARAEQAGEDSPDCSQMLTRARFVVKVVEGDVLNIKVTRPADLRLAESYLRARSEGRL